MVALIKLQILSIIATSLTNLIGILAFATDYWSIFTYDFVKLRSYAKWIIIDEIESANLRIINNTNDTETLININYKLPTTVMSFEKNLLLFSTHKGIFRQCNYLSDHVRSMLKIPKCQEIKMVNIQYDEYIHGLNKPGREFTRKYFFIDFLFFYHVYSR